MKPPRPPRPLNEMSLPETWEFAAQQLEWTLAQPRGRDLRPLVDLTRQIARSVHARSYRAGTSLLQTLVISTAPRHGLEWQPDQPYITVDAERTAAGGEGFCVLYHGGDYGGGGDWDRAVQARARSYGTDDHAVILANLKRDLPDYHYPCACAAIWETLPPLLARLWRETHPDGPERPPGAPDTAQPDANP